METVIGSPALSARTSKIGCKLHSSAVMLCSHRCCKLRGLRRYRLESEAAALPLQNTHKTSPQQQPQTIGQTFHQRSAIRQNIEWIRSLASQFSGRITNYRRTTVFSNNFPSCTVRMAALDAISSLKNSGLEVCRKRLLQRLVPQPSMEKP